MAGIQSSINSMIGSASHAVSAVKSYQKMQQKKAALIGKPNSGTSSSPQALASQRARESAQAAVEARAGQRRKFSEYLAKMSKAVGKQVASKFSPAERQKIMNAVDKEANNGRHI